jgi:predicted cupin superfamily sugar epimerase
MDPHQLIETLDLKPHPEGGFYCVYKLLNSIHL